MDWFIALDIGIGLGVACTYLVFEMRRWWKTSGDLRASAEKARKERRDRDLKAQQDAAKSRDALLQAAVRVFILVLAVVVATWVIWMMATS